ncbi:MAG: Type 1 glutamine amidotransferase-like domain-containing protein [Clostridia bacterium]|nr:Type 1 glutamine amidotransferase-like domain-containing protein [Clostridia bacterium]
MTKKIVAIGGGENGRITFSGEKMPYELREIDTEIIKLTGKENPNFLFLGHAQNRIEYEELYFKTMKAIYGEMFGCKCETIKRSELGKNYEHIEHLVDWADIIYQGGGDTKSMIELWKSTKFDSVLKNAWEMGKVLCGVSAGANCWFSSCSSDSLKIISNDPNAAMITVDGLGLVDAFFTPHCNVANETTNRLQHMKEALLVTDMVGIGISNCCAIEIIDNTYRLIRCDASNYGIEAYGVKTYYKNNEYFEEKIDTTNEFKPLNELLSK